MIPMQINIVGQRQMKRNNVLLRWYFFTVMLFLAAGAGYLWWKDALGPVDTSDRTTVPFAVMSGESVRDITTQLAKERLIRSPTAFFILVRIFRFDSQLQAGAYRLNRGMDAGSVAEELRHGMSDVWVTIPEGWRNEEVALKFAQTLSIPESEFLSYATEGYMFPDTYSIPRSATAAGVAALLKDTFDKKVAALRVDSQKTGLTFPQVITLASIVEREGNSDDDRPVIAGILLKRLQAGWPLETDATLQFALGYQANAKTWWKKEVTEDDKRLASPYNTYMHVGLPPGPIANPGLSSIQAVIYAKPTAYWYYIHDRKGAVHFAKTLEEHNANIKNYL